MKTFAILILSFWALHTPDWLTDFDIAKQEAKQNSKMILLNFSGSDWCAPCIKLKKDVFERSEFADFAEKNLILVRADFPRHKKNKLSDEQTAHNEKLAERYNPQGKFPLTLLLDAEGKVIRSWDGFSGGSPQDFIGEIEKSLHGK